VGALEIPTVALSAYEAARMAAVVMRRCSEEMVRWVPIVLKVTLVAAVVTSAGFIWVGGAANPILPVPVSPRLETLAEKNERLFRRDVLPELLAELRKMLPEDNSPQLAEVRAFGSAVECEFVTAKVLLPDSGRTRLRLSYCTVRRRMEVTVDLFGDGMWKVIDPKRPVIFEFDVFGLGRLNADTGHERIAFGQSAFEKIPADGQAVDELIRRTFGEPANELILPVGVTAVSGDGNRPFVVAHDHGLFDWDGRKWRYRGECSGWFLTLVGDRFYADRDGVISRRVDDTGGRWETVAHRPPEDWNKFRVCGMAVAGGRLHYSVHRHPDGATALWTKLLSDPQAKWVRGEMVAHPNHLIGAGDWLFSVDVDNALVRRSAAEPTAAWERLGRLPTATGEIQAIGDRLLAFDRAKGSIFARPLAGSAVEWQVIGRIRSRNADRTFDK